MIIQDIQVFLIAIPLRITFSQSNQKTTFSDSVVVKITTQNEVFGYGESCPRLYVSGETSPQVLEALNNIRPALLGRELVSLQCIQQFLYPKFAELGLAARCALEMALIDALAQTHQQAVYQLFGGEALKEISYTGIIPLCPDEQLLHLLDLLSAFNFDKLKLKIGADLQKTLRQLKLVREVLGHEPTIRVDANESFEQESALKQIPVLMDHGISVFEQLLPARQANDMVSIVKKYGDQAEFMLDESLLRLTDIRAFIEQGVCNRINIKLSKMGGILAAMEIYQWANSNGIPCQLGAHYGETSILSAAGIHFSAIATELVAFEGAWGTHLLKEDICEDPIMLGTGGKIYPTRLGKEIQGWGLDIKEERLLKYAQIKQL